MKKRLAAGLLCLLLLLQLSPAPPARASGSSVCFMAAGDSILPLSDDTMPFWSGGYLYVDSASITSSSAWPALGVARTVNGGGAQLVLYNRGKSLWFDRGADHGYDLDGNTYTPGCLERNGRFFVPAASVAQFFGLLYSVTNVHLQSNGQRIRGNLVWLRQPGFVMADQEFFAAATFAIAQRYEDYLKEKEEVVQESPPEVEAPESGPEIEGRIVYLCLEAGDGTPALLDVLDRYNAQAAFFCTPDFLESQGDLLRRMAATGQSIGILADAGEAERTVAEQLEAGNRALERATCGKTRLALIRNGREEDRESARALGFRCLEPDLDRERSGLWSAANAASLLRRISNRRGNVSVWMGDQAGAAGLRAFLTAAGEMDGQCLAWTETA